MIPQDETMPVPRTMQAGQNDASTLPDRESESGQDIQLEEASSSRPAAVVRRTNSGVGIGERIKFRANTPVACQPEGHDQKLIEPKSKPASIKSDDAPVDMEVDLDQSNEEECK